MQAAAVQRIRRASGIQRSSTTRARVVIRASSREYELLQGRIVYNVASGGPVEITSLWEPNPSSRAAVAFFTHWGDLSSQEFAQKVQKQVPTLKASGVTVVPVGIGTVEAGRVFARMVGLDPAELYADPAADCYKALGFNPGFAPDVQVSGYAKLLPMLMGVGSPGTIQEVLRGYVGDRNAKQIFPQGSFLGDAFGAALGQGYQRPLELATLRLQNMAAVLSKWNELAPTYDDALLTQQGGALVFDGSQLVWRHDDSGILSYADVDRLVSLALPTALPAVQS